MSRSKSLLIGVLLLFISSRVPGQEAAPTLSGRAGGRLRTNETKLDDGPREVLSTEEWHRMDSAVDRGLAFLASQEQPNGSFPSLPFAQPGVTSLCVLAFMAHGHTPGNGPYGERLERAVKFIMDCQKPSGLIMLTGPDSSEIDRNLDHDTGVAGTYDHAISSLTLAELYGMNPAASGPKLQALIAKSLRVSLAMQRWPKEHSYDKGGWRYVIDYDES